MKNKKAQEGVNTLRVVIICVVIGIILFTLVMKISEMFGQQKDRELCRTSVLGKYRLTQVGAKVVEGPINLQCATRVLEIREDGIYKANQIGEKFRKIIGLDIKDEDDTEERVKEAIAEEMYDCKYQFPVNPYPVSINPEVKCIVCAEIGFDEDFRYNIKNIGEFEAFLKSSYIKKEESFFDYIYSKDLKTPLYENILDTSKIYLVLYSFSDEIGEIIGKKMIGMGHFTMLIESSKVEKACTRLY